MRRDRGRDRVDGCHRSAPVSLPFINADAHSCSDCTGNEVWIPIIILVIRQQQQQQQPGDTGEKRDFLSHSDRDVRMHLTGLIVPEQLKSGNHLSFAIAPLDDPESGLVFA